MVELHIEGLVLPVADPALLAAVLFEAFGKQAKLEVMPTRPAANHE
jgi:hypothetical protein